MSCKDYGKLTHMIGSHSIWSFFLTIMIMFSWVGAAFPQGARPTVPFDSSFTTQYFGFSDDFGSQNAVSLVVFTKVVQVKDSLHLCAAYRTLKLHANLRRHLQRGAFVTSDGTVLRKGLKGILPLPVRIDGSKVHTLLEEGAKKEADAEIAKSYGLDRVKGEPVACLKLSIRSVTAKQIETSRMVLGRSLMEYEAVR